jgi:phage shock protein E
MLKKVPELVAEIRSKINCLNAQEAVAKSREDNGVLIDVREPAEFAQKAPKGAVNIPRGLIEMKMVELYPDANVPIYIHCATGGRATFAAEQLVRLGYQHVYAITCPLDKVFTAYE